MNFEAMNRSAWSDGTHSCAVCRKESGAHTGGFIEREPQPKQTLQSGNIPKTFR